MENSPIARGCTGRQTSDGECDWAHHGVIVGGSSAGAIAGEQQRQHKGSTAAATRSLARGKARLSNARRTELQGDLGEMLRVPIGLESRRRHEFGRGCPAAAAGARTPASWKLGLSIKRVGKLLGVLRHEGATCVGGTSGRRVELGVGATGDGNGGSVPRAMRTAASSTPFVGARALRRGSRPSTTWAL
jgi:hypothetical protein